MAQKLIYVGSDSNLQTKLADLLAGSGLDLSFLAGNEVLASKISASALPDYDVKCILASLREGDPTSAELVRLVRKGAWKPIPVVLLASAVELQTAQALVQLGVDGILCAPLTKDSLLRQIQNAGARREQLEMKELMGGSDLLAG